MFMILSVKRRDMKSELKIRFMTGEEVMRYLISTHG